MRLFAPLAALAMAATLGLSAAQAAPVSYTAIHNYGNGPGDVNPGGNDPLTANYVQVRDFSKKRFNDSFDFSSFAYTTISSITLTLNYNGAGPVRPSNPTEFWRVRILGSNNAAATDDQFGALTSSLSTTSYLLTAAIDTLRGRNAFANALNTQSLAFLFAENTSGRDIFRLYSARIDIVGDLAGVSRVSAAVPLPAGGLLLLAGLGGLAAVRRRRTR